MLKKLLAFFRKIGLLKSGSVSYKGNVKDMPSEMVTGIYKNKKEDQE